MSRVRQLRTRLVHALRASVTQSVVAVNVGVFVGLLSAALLLSLIAERLGIPNAVLLVGAGIVAGSLWHVRTPFNFSAGLLFLFLPPLIFEAAWNVHLEELQRAWRAISLLAVPGTIFIAFAIAGTVTALHALPFDAALLLGAIVAATDPIAVIGVFRTFAIPSRVRTIVEAESIANDGIAVVLYTSALALTLGGAVNVVSAIGHGALALVGGIAIGSLGGTIAWWIVRTTAAPEYEVTTTVALAYITYLAADRLSLSGIFACASAGIVLRALQQQRAFMTHVEDADRFWNTTAYITNAVVFIETGLVITFDRIANEPALIVTAIAVVFLSRALIVGAVLRNRREQITAFLAGMRGALPLALALALPEATPHRAEIIDTVFATVFVTLVIQGLTLSPVLARLYPPIENTIDSGGEIT